MGTWETEGLEGCLSSWYGGIARDMPTVPFQEKCWEPGNFLSSSQDKSK